RVAAWLRQKGIHVRAYHADLDPECRVELEQQLVWNQVKALVATVALGMGFDKPDIGFVVHYQRPGSVVAYYQQVGRAGRAVESSYAILLNGGEDDRIQEYFFTSAFPSTQESQDVLKVLEKSDGMKRGEILSQVNTSSSRLERILKLLEVEGVIAKEEVKYFRTANPWTPEAGHAEAILELRRRELARMQEFVSTKDCLMQFVQQELNDPTAQPCGRCANCAGPIVESTIDPRLAAEARQFLRMDIQ